MKEHVGAGPVGLDTVLFIYFIEEHPVWLPYVEPVFRALDGGALQAVASELTLLETLVVPYRHGDEAFARRYEEVLTAGRGLELGRLDRSILRAGARLRAIANLKTPDALHMATALAHECSAFLTHDRRLPSLPGLPVVQLSELSPHA